MSFNFSRALASLEKQLGVELLLPSGTVLAAVSGDARTSGALAFGGIGLDADRVLVVRDQTGTEELAHRLLVEVDGEKFRVSELRRVKGADFVVVSLVAANKGAL